MTITASTPRPVSDTGLSLTALGVGTAPLGGLYADVPREQALAMLERAWDLGIRYFDTAPMYGLTRSEHLLGHVLREKHEPYALSTKVGRLMTNSRAGRQLPPEPPKNPLDPGFHNALPFREVFDYSYDAIMRSYDDSQQRLGLRDIDLLYVHDIGPVTHGDANARHWEALTRGGGFRALQELKGAGDIKGFGLGVNEWEVIRDALEETDLDCCMLAGRYSLLDRDAEETFLPLAQKRGVALALGGVYNSGILAAPKGGRRKFNYADAPAEVVARVEALRGVCDDHRVPLAAAAIRFPIRHPAVTSVVIGAKTAEQLQQNVDWFGQNLPDSLWSDLDTALANAEAA
ncbi:aldo/keto reductase [Salipiger mucosus]|uniref:L-fuco-beta-pyranose dehydrogenase n=1 Tax=Salipiger mucosus DSM 16094 TaxID=1123237 RepID=S9Q7X9_9RHOB|nr:aldo/keto reductase [Salipiger mucosus]EPX75713.1 L-fuco-beta-pyranose dehydrogenase [Salipiger mucosus DSM 16094]